MSQTALKSYSLLFIEDNTTIRNEISETLRLLFANVWVSCNGVGGYEAYQKYQPDIVLSDVKMPQMDGIELTRLIRKSDQITAIALLTSYSEQELLLSALNAQVDAFILKPIKLEALTNSLIHALKRKISQPKRVRLDEHTSFDLASGELTKNDTTIQLGTKEKQLLTYFIENHNRALSKDEIIEKIWPMEEATEPAIKNLLYRLRNKIGKEYIVSTQRNHWKLISDLN